MTIQETYAALAALAAALIGLLIYHLAFVRPALARMQALLSVHDGLIGAGHGAADRLGGLETQVGQILAGMERTTGRIVALEGCARADLSQVGFVRYDAFDDTGSELSYALALLTREGDGVVLNSIYSRTDTRTYGKLVRAYAPAVSASQEELLAIERAKATTTA